MRQGVPSFHHVLWKRTAHTKQNRELWSLPLHVVNVLHGDCEQELLRRLSVTVNFPSRCGCFSWHILHIGVSSSKRPKNCEKETTCIINTWSHVNIIMLQEGGRQSKCKNVDVWEINSYNKLCMYYNVRPYLLTRPLYYFIAIHSKQNQTKKAQSTIFFSQAAPLKSTWADINLNRSIYVLRCILSKGNK